MRKKRSDWRCRREEYLRRTGRRDELISEGYEAAPPPSQWIVLPGGRGGNPKEQPVSVSLRLVKEARQKKNTVRQIIQEGAACGSSGPFGGWRPGLYRLTRVELVVNQMQKGLGGRIALNAPDSP